MPTTSQFTRSATAAAFSLFLPLVSSFVANTASFLKVERSTAHLLAQSSSSLRCRAGHGLDELRQVQRDCGGVIGGVTYDQESVVAPVSAEKLDSTGHESADVLLSGFETGASPKRRSEMIQQAAMSEAVLIDKSHWGIICVRGEDRTRFLHSQGTNAFEGVREGTVVPTCFTTNVGRVVDFCEAIILQDEVWLLSSPHRWQQLLKTMDKFIFPMDKTTVSSLSDELAVFCLVGPHADQSLARAGCDSTPAPGCFMEWEFEGQKVIVFGHSRSIMTGAKTAVNGEVDDVPCQNGLQEYSVLAPNCVSAKLWSVTSEPSSVLVAGEEDWHMLRIKQGFPFPGKELTSDYNPLEAGLWHTVHFDKGCYIGQETISRVNAYKAVKTVLCGVSFEEERGTQVCEGDELVAEESGTRAGIVTSLLAPEEGSPQQGLAYVRSQAGGVGLKVITKDGGVRGTILQLPYPTRSDAESAQPPVKQAEGAESQVMALDVEDEKAKDRARKAAKLEAMQKKLDALKARRKAAS